MPDEPPALPPSLAIGVTSLPTELSEAARRELRRGLARHEAGDYEASEAAFRALSDASPGHVLVRFDHACALARLGRFDEARALLEVLLAEDYPTIAPRLASDPDLEALRSGSHHAALEALRERVRAAYVRALEQGMPVVHAIEERTPTPSDEAMPALLSVQAGVWLHDERRFVPMAPRVTERGDDYGQRTLASAVLDRARGVAFAVTGAGTQSEGGDYINDFEVIAWRAIDGVELGRARNPCRATLACSFPAVQASDAGVVLRYADLDHGSGDTEHTRAIGGSGAWDDATRPMIACSQDGCSTLLSTSEASAVTTSDGEHATVRWPDETEQVFELDPAHRWHRHFRRGAHVIALPDGDAAYYLATAEAVDYDWVRGYGAAAISRLDRASGRALLLLGGRDVVRLGSAPDGSVYLQIARHLERRAPGSSEGEALPEGLVLETGSYVGMGRHMYRP